MISAKLPHIFYGGDYNPEQWPEAVWHDDVRLMREAGVNLATVGVFSWALLEPRPGAYDFGWLDRVLDLLAANGIHADLATATASPPPWMATRYPESLPVTREGVRLVHGARQQYCPSSPVYREAAARLVRALATRYRDHPALALWHINNEYGCHVSECYCDVSAEAFRAWLRARYRTLDALNAAWGTAFWSQHYGAWEEILPPRAAPTFSNPTQQLDFRRFSSDALLECFEMEQGILREVTPEIPITTNFMGFFKPLDYWRWAERMDVVSDDSYPDPNDPDAPIHRAMTSDLMRSLGRGRPWLLMEQTPSQVNWRPQNALKRPGQMRLWSLQALARGADGILFFQWRAAQAGAEKFHGAMVPHVGTERSRAWREVAALGSELQGLDGLLGGETPARVAIVLDWPSWWAVEQDSKPHAGLRVLEQVLAYYRPLYAANIAVQFLPPDADPTPFDVVLVPNLYMASAGVGERYERYVESGGTVIMSFFSGIVDEADHICLGGYPAPFRRMLGIRVEEFDPYGPERRNTIVGSDGQHFECDLWSDVIDLEGAEALATFVGDFYAGRPAVTRHSLGAGVAYYLGTRPAPAYMAELLGRVLAEKGIAAPFTAPSGVEVVRRTAGGRDYFFLLNHSAHDCEVALPAGLRNAITNADAGAVLQLAPFDGHVFMRASAEPAAV